MSEDLASKSFRWILGLPLCLGCILANLFGGIFWITFIPLCFYYEDKISVFLKRPATLGEVFGCMLFVVMFVTALPPFACWGRLKEYLAHLREGTWVLPKSKGGPDYFDND
jgi:hypothetical protein